MIGVVLAGREGAREVLGLPTSLRALLALQAAGVERVLVLGEHAEALARRALADDRTRVSVEVAERWPAGGALVVADGVVLDARAARELAAEGPGAVVRGAGEVLAGVTDDAGARAGDARGARPAALTGVLLAAHGRGGARAAERALLASLRKPQDGWVSRAINRRISLAVTRVLARTGVRPNALSLAILAVGLWGAYLASRGERGLLALGGVLFQAQSVLDGCDGELSRLSFRGSKLGEWLDTVGDDLTNYGFFAGAALGVHALGVGGRWAPLLGFVGVGVGVVTSAIEYRYLISIGSGDLLKYPLGFGQDPEPTADPTPLARLLGALRPAFKRDFFVFATMLAALAGPHAMLAMLALFAAGAVATFSAVLASEVRRRGR